jgi:DNA replication and repair protein RecF
MLTQLKLAHFRNHAQLDLDFSKLVVIVGENARGKTNIIEAIYLLATGESIRAQKIEEMVEWDKEVGHVTGKVGEDEVRVTVTKGMVQGKRVQKRLFKVNGASRRKQDFVGILPVVLFWPEHMDLVAGEPGQRRKFLDEVLVQTDREYRWSLASYQKGLKQRNRLLDQIRDGRTNKATLYFWDQLLIKEASVIHAKREEVVKLINTNNSGAKQLRLIYKASKITPEKLTSHYEAEVALGYTLSGPHKDDVGVMDGDRDLGIYGSRGEQRMAVLWLKKAQLNLMESASGLRPTLLLDDILSELDHHHVAEVVALCAQQQTILTTTDEALSDYFGNSAHVIRLGAE